ncbi:MbnP family protein [Hymenobacter sp.]|jgi:hypothetical protein|uniref:MbnP family protein n=1 Tax=Hymenobacter sp. TaxID=1898978 RepID=UPI002EDA61D3
MKFLKYTIFCLSFLASSVAFTACKDDTDMPTPTDMVGNLNIEFENVVGDSPLELNRRAPYFTPSGDDFTVSIFRYYISNIKLKRADGTEFVQPESYYLVDQERDQSRKFTIPNVPAGDYTQLTFILGVDAARNTAGAQTGALAVSDMFWSWDSGYIFTKLEGRSSKSPNQALAFHIAGFQPPHNTIRNVSPAMNNKIIQVRQTRTPKIRLRADVLRMFTGTTTILFKDVYNVMGGESAAKIADNQEGGMFTVNQIDSN